MKLIWTHLDIDAPADVAWALLTNIEQWPAWGPSVRSAQIDGGHLALGATGTVTTVLGARLPFEITTFEEGTGWGWKVAGIPATDHSVTPLDGSRCRVGFGVPWVAAPYLVVCRVALQRIQSISEKVEATS